MEVLPFSTGEAEVVAQPVFVVDNGQIRPMPDGSQYAPVSAVEIRTQLERDHEMAIALSENDTNENVRLTEQYRAGEELTGLQPMDIETGANLVTREVTHTESGFESVQEHFDEIEYIASSRIRQLLTTSTCIVICEFILLVAMCGVGGFADLSVNPLIGPPTKIFIRFQAKQASLMKYEHQWLRALFAIFLHAGFIHYIPIMLIQLRIGGYLNLIFGTPVFLGIYLISGVFGNLLACVVEPTSVAVGSQGAMMGLLCGWMCYVGFRWQYVEQHFSAFAKNRNRQIGIATFCMAVLLLVAFAPFVDVASIFGGALQGFCWGSVYFCKTLNHKRKKRQIRFFAILISALLYGGLIYYLMKVFKPPEDLVGFYDSGDDDFNI